MSTREQPRPQISRVVYAASGNSGGHCCNYVSNYDKRAKGYRCRVCGWTFAELPVFSSGHPKQEESK